MKVGVFSKIDLSLVVLIFLIIVIFLYRSKFNIKHSKNRTNISVMITSALVLLLQILDTIILQYPYSYLVPITKLINIIGFILSPVVSYLWLKYVIQILDVNINLNILSIPLIVNTIISLLTYKYEFIFAVNCYNNYNRGPLFFVPILITYLYFIITIYTIIKNKSNIEKREYQHLILFEVIPIITIIFQIIFINLTIVWASVGISIIIYYLYIQENLIKYDTLTGVWNRFTFESYATNSLINKNICFSLIYVDLDDFKNINDTYGHDEGDIALINMAKFLKNYFLNVGKVVRIGGDEFIIIVYCDNYTSLKEIIDNMKIKMTQYNKELNKEYNLSYSCGYDIFDEKYEDLDSLIKSVDELMYINKRNKKKKNKNI